MAQQFVEWLERLDKKTHYVLLLATGVSLAALGLAPLSWFVVYFIFVPISLWILSAVKKPFWAGLWFGFGFNTVAFYWFAHAFFTKGIGSLAPIAIGGVVFLLSFYWGLAFFAARKFWRTPIERVLSFTFFWSIAFWVQGTVFSGLPWNLPAQNWVASLELAQNFSWGGIYGISFIAIFCSASLSVLLNFIITKNKSLLILPISAISIMFLLWCFGAYRLSFAENNYSQKDIIVIQPNILQKHKWNPKHRSRIIETYFAQSIDAIKKIKNKNREIIMVWPEAALPINIERAVSIRQSLAKIIPENMILISGFVRFQHPKIFNSLYVIDDKGDIVETYDKNHLVPGGEYLPLQSFLETIGIQQITGPLGGYKAGTSRNLLKSRAQPLICFEISFPREIIKTSRPDWLVNITNDGWYGSSPGPYQHFQLAQIRAIEFGLPVVRAANTGISAIIDPYGRIKQNIPLNKAGTIYASPLPQALAKTFYSRFGEWIFLLFLSLNVVAIKFFAPRNS